MSILNSVTWTAFAKITGVMRDVSIISLFGISKISDAIFIGMTIAMYWQLVAYHGSLSFLISRRFPAFLGQRSVRLLLYFVTPLMLFGYLAYVFDWGLVAVSGWFVLHGPLSAFLGTLVATRVLVGDSVALVRATTVQNIVICFGAGLTYYSDVEEVVLLSWVASLIAASIVTGRVKEQSYEQAILQQSTSSIKLPSLWQSISVPMLAFAVVLVERFFYSNAAGAVAVVKVLETLATSLVFVSQIFFYNPYLSKLSRYLKQQNENVAKMMRNGLALSIKKSLMLSVPIYLLGLFLLVLLMEYLPDRFKLPESIAEQEWMFGLLYLAFLVVWLMREHLERFCLLKCGAQHVVNSAIIVLAATLFLNLLTLHYVPYSVLIISVILSLVRCVYLAAKSQLLESHHG